jgi:hypothetical protein
MAPIAVQPRGGVRAGVKRAGAVTASVYGRPVAPLPNQLGGRYRGRWLVLRGTNWGAARPRARQRDLVVHRPFGVSPDK